MIHRLEIIPTVILHPFVHVGVVCALMRCVIARGPRLELMLATSGGII